MTQPRADTWHEYLDTALAGFGFWHGFWRVFSLSPFASDDELELLTAQQHLEMAWGRVLGQQLRK